MPGGISGLYTGTRGALEYRKNCQEKCKGCPYAADGKCRIDEDKKRREDK